MRIPTVNMNGDAKRTLIEDNMAAHNAVRDAVEKVAAACPNGRNFYVQDDNAIHDAIAEHRKRLELLEVVLVELESIVMGVMKQ